MGQGQKFLTRVGSGQVFMAWVGSGRISHLWFGFEFEKFALKMSNFSIFCPLGQKKSLRVASESTRVGGRSASYLLRVKSKLGSGQGPSLVGSDRSGLGQFSVARVRSGQPFLV